MTDDFGIRNQSLGSGIPSNRPHKSAPQIPKDACSHLISVGLWESITGDKLNPEKLLQIQDIFVPSNMGGSKIVSSKSIQYLMMARDRQECRTLQNMIQDGNNTTRDEIFNALYPNLGELSIDSSANFVIQKMCEHATKEQQGFLLTFFLEDINRIVNHPNGCRVLQKYIEFTTPANIDKIFMALLPTFVPLCSSQNGNHIAQRFISNLPERIPLIIDIIRPHVVVLVLDNWGCRVIQQLFEKLPIESLLPLVDQILKHADHLAANQFGNYVIQNIISSGNADHINELVKLFKGHFYEFSIHKFASNVIEKCIRKADEAQKMMIFNEIIGDGDEYDNDRIERLIKDQFGNYVIQRIIEFGTKNQKNAINNVVNERYDYITQNSFARHVMTCLSKNGF